VQDDVSAGLGYCQGQPTADPQGCSGNQDSFSAEGHIFQIFLDLFLPGE
jgi:hypothetical protein